MADNITYRFIQNVGDYFPSGYFTDDFVTKVQTCSGRSSEEMQALCSPYVQIRGEYEEFKNFIINAHARKEDEIKHTHDWHTLLLKKLGYETSNAYQEAYVVKEGTDTTPTEIIPVRHIIRSGERISMLIMEMQNLITVNDTEPDGLFKQQYDDNRTSGQQRYYGGQWRQVIPKQYLDHDKYHFSPAIINQAITQIFLMPEERRPHYVLMLAGNTIFLFDQDKWARGSYLQFSLDDLYSQAQIKTYRLHYALFHLLCCKEALAADGQTLLMDTLIEESYKNAYEVTKDLKEGVIFAVETLANEALYYMRHVANRPFGKYDKATDTYDETDDGFEAEVKDDCLTIVYRLLFLFYAESREELEILPIGDEVYKLGYSLESLRDLEMMRLNSQASRDGYFFDDSIRHLFSLLAGGHHATESDTNNKSFRVRPIDSPLFNNNNLRHLADVKIRNSKWQEIIKALSLSKKKSYCGRISYANLGVNQLGSVYESLLAFRGFYAEEDYIEVHKANEPQDGTFLVPYSRMGDFDISEVLKDSEGRPQILPRGTFVYRLNGRDRQKSASYYTPEVLTRSTVKYTLKAIIDDVRDNKRKATELLELKILEPAMGAAAFQNEVINQLAEAYLVHQQRQQREDGRRNWRIAPDKYRDELQKVKAFIATHNVYGVDLNPTAVELGKLSLWLNVMHKDMETPFFANRICVGNAVIGAWLKVYSKGDFYALKGRKNGKEILLPNKWWEKAPHKVKFFSSKVNRSVNEIYHFLLPDQNMLGVRSIKEQKKANPEGDKRMATLLKEWTEPIGAIEFQILQRLSAKIDVLLKDYYTDQISIEKYTNNRKEIWDGIDHNTPESLFKELDLAESYARKQELFDTRYGHNNAYRKLKLAMDYWCALWFWEYQDAASLPTRREYWADIEALLDVDDSKLDNRTRQALERANSGQVQEETAEYKRLTEEESQIVAKSQEELLTEAHGQTTLFADDDPLRLKIVCRMSERYRFFHPMLEFLEVFWQRTGFDVICGNPPWLKLEFDEKGILSEKYPEVAIRKVSAPDARKMRDEMFERIPLTEELYHSEEIDTACSSTFMNAYCNYPLLVGQQTNLYKCVLENGFSQLSDTGFMGLLHPDGIYDDPKGAPLRKTVFHRLRYHFQYQNEFKLFAEIKDYICYACHVYGSNQEEIDFININNLFHPNTVDGCFVHDGHGECGGIKNSEGRWNVASHAKRIVRIHKEELQILAKTFEGSNDYEVTKLVNIHNKDIVSVLRSLSTFKTHVSNFQNIISEGLHESGAVDKGWMKRDVRYPDWNKQEMIYSGPHVYVSNPLNKTSRQICKLNSDYDCIDLDSIDDNYSPRTNYTPQIPLPEFRDLIKGFVIGQNEKGESSYDCWMDYYRVATRLMLNQAGERTLTPAIIPPCSSHIVGLISCAFKDLRNTVEYEGLMSSIVLDFFMKTIGASNLHANRVESFPLGIADLYKPALFARALRLNCVTNRYADLWSEVWTPAYKDEQWSIHDKRLKPWSALTEEWNHDIPLRNYFERRQALVEIDVISAMALGLSLDDLEMIYTIQFPVLQQNEADTWYDQKGNIVFTCSKGLTGVGLDRPQWNAMRGEEIKDEKGNVIAHRGAEATYVHTIDPQKSELYGGQQVTYYAPYTKCDRVEDYRKAWAHFEKIFNK